MRSDEDGEFWHVIAGGVIGGLFELGSQLISNGGDFSNLNWGKIGVATGVGAAISGMGNVVMERMSGTTDPNKIGISFAVGFCSSLLGSGIGKIAKKVCGKIAINSLAKKLLDK